MILSLTLIAERLRARNRSITVHAHNSQRYSDVMLFTEDAPMRQEILYLSQGIPDRLPEPCARSGLLCLVPAGEYAPSLSRLPDLPCNCLLIGSGDSFGSLFNELSMLFIHLRDQMDIFKTAVYTRQSLQMLVEMIYDILGNPAYLVDSSFKVMAIDNKHDTREVSASWKRLEDEGYLPFDLVSNLINSGELSGMERSNRAEIIHSSFFYVPFINYNLRQRGKVRGHLFIAGIRQHIRPGDLELADTLGSYIQEALLRNPGFQNQRGDYYEHFMRDLISGKLVDPLHIRQQMRFLGILPEDHHTLCVLHASPEQGLSDERIASQLERCCGARSVFYKDKIVAMFSHRRPPDPEALHQSLESVCTELNCKIGVSDTFRGFYDLNTYYVQAEWALLAPAPAAPIRYYRDHQAAHILHSFARQTKWQAAIPSRLWELRQYDRDNAADLTGTLLCYLQNERSLLATARKLYIHRNTLAYRISKITELCGFDLEDHTTRLRLLLSLELMALFPE